MIRTRITKRYTRALFELATEAGKVEAVGRDLTALEGLLAADASLRDALMSPVLTRDAKAEILNAVAEAADVEDLVAHFLHILLEARKLPLLSDVVAAFRALADEAAGEIRGTAITPMPLAAADAEALAQALSKALKKRVVLDAQIDPSLRGGVVARVGNLVFDGSLRTQLMRMRETLIKG